MKSLSVIIPARNEDRFIGETLQRLGEAIRASRPSAPCPVQVIVVDNASRDQTAEIARQWGAVVLAEPIPNIARARNTGARVADGEVLFFLDADTLVPATVLSRIAREMSDPLCIGGAVAVLYRPSRALVRAYLWCWRILGRLCRMAQGAAQFCRRETFSALGGYDEAIYMGEDVEFYWRMMRIARRQGGKVGYISDVQAITSPRRYDQWPLWKTLLWTNPVMAAMLHRQKGAWRGWYEDAPR